MIIDQLLFRISSFIVYYWKAQSNLYIHSPFIFDWVNTLNQNLSKSNNSIALYRAILDRDLSKFIYSHNNSEICVSVSDRYRKTSISDYYGKILSSTCSYLNAKHFLELGTSLGVSAAYLASSNSSIKGVTIDSNLNSTTKSQSLFDEFFFPHQVEFNNGKFNDILPYVLKDENKFDFVFIDGDHKYESTIDYVSQIKLFLSDNAVIVLDDIRWSRDMYRAWQELIQLTEFNYTVDFGRIGLLFKVNNNSPKQHFYIN